MFEIAVSIRERVPRMMILRLWHPGPEVFAALSQEFGLVWPVAPNTRAGDGVSVLWLAPNEWAVVDLSEEGAREGISRACGNQLHHLAEVSAGRLAFELSGPMARSILSKGCSLDLHPRMFPIGTCAQAPLSQVPVLIEPFASATQGAIAYRVYADISDADYLRAWFSDAAGEFTGEVRHDWQVTSSAEQALEIGRIDGLGQVIVKS